MAAGNDNEDNIDDDEASNLVQVPRGVGGVVEVHKPLVAPGPQRVEVECEHHGQGVSAGVLTNQRSVITFFNQSEISINISNQSDTSIISITRFSRTLQISRAVL